MPTLLLLPETTKPKSLPTAIILAGLISGTLDINGAFIHYFMVTGKNPNSIFPYIASGVFGKAAFNGSNSMIIWGIIFHYIIALIFTAFFFLIYPNIKFLSKNIVVTGLLYGIFAWAIMSFMVVPLSAIGRFPSSVVQSAIGCLILMFAIGLPIAIMAYRHYLKK